MTGAASRAKGVRAEQHLARYLRQWWPGAERKSDNGWRTGGRESADHGDIRGTDLIVWQVKHRKDFRLDEFMAQTAEQATAAGADFGVLVQRRDGTSDPGRWWAWLTVTEFGSMVGGFDVVPRDLDAATLNAPVRTELRHVVALLLAAGYGTPAHGAESLWNPLPAPTTLGTAESG